MSIASDAVDGSDDRLWIHLEIVSFASLTAFDAANAQAALFRAWEFATAEAFGSALAAVDTGDGMTIAIPLGDVNTAALDTLLLFLAVDLANVDESETEFQALLTLDIGSTAADAVRLAHHPAVADALMWEQGVILVTAVWPAVYKRFITPHGDLGGQTFDQLTAFGSEPEVVAWIAVWTRAAARIRQRGLVAISTALLRATRRTFVAPQNFASLIGALDRTYLQVLVGPPETGRHTAAVMALMEIAERLYEIDPGATAATLPELQPNVGYVWKPSGGNTDVLPDVALLRNKLAGHRAFLVVIAETVAGNVPFDLLFEYEPPHLPEVVRAHLTAAIGSDSASEVLVRTGIRPTATTAEAVRLAHALSEIDHELPPPASPSDSGFGAPPEASISRDFWTHDDKLGYARYADAIVAFIRHRDTQPPLTIGIRAPWGAGKTSLMRMVQHRLDPQTMGTATRIRLTDRSRSKLADTTRPEGAVSMRELARRLRGSSAADLDVKDLDVDIPAAASLPDPQQDWRPTVWFNPWMYQSGEQVWAGLAHEIITQVTERMPTGDRERFWLRLNLRRADQQALRRKVYTALIQRLLPVLFAVTAAVLVICGLLLLGWLVPAWTNALRWTTAVLVSLGLPTAAFDVGRRTIQFFRRRAAEEFHDLVREPATGLLRTPDAKTVTEVLMPDPGYESRLGFLHLVQTDMRRVLDLIATPQRPLVVFVDDLDRCSPGTVVQAIEAINLFLAGEFPNCLFVLALEPQMLAAHIDAAYAAAGGTARAGAATTGWRFLDKFVQLPISLPGSPTRIEGYVASLVGDNGRQASTNPTVGNRSAEDVKRIEAAILHHNPSLDDLPFATAAAQREVLGLYTAQIDPTAIAAATRVMSRMYNDADAAAIMAVAANQLGTTNPREIKRLLNLFRFYSFVVEQDRIQGGSGYTPQQIAKVCILSVRWPHLLHLLQPDLNSDGLGTALQYLESASREPAMNGDSALWTNATARAGLSDSPSGRQSLDDLRRFLADGPPIAEIASTLL